MSKLQAIAEIVSATVHDLVAQRPVSNETDDQMSLPRFGSFVRVDSSSRHLSIIAVVNNVLTGPIDGVHRTAAFGLTRHELRVQQPQIFSLLRIDIHASIIGYLEKGQAFQYLPPYPPDVHDFVYHATTHDIDSVTRDFDFLRLLSSGPELPQDELLAAAVREAYLAKGQDMNFLLAAGEAFCQLYRSQYDRLVSVLRKIRPNE